MSASSSPIKSCGMPAHPELFVNNTIFPELEGKQYEFKRDIHPKLINKAFQTICGFLNSDGGYMIFGIDDVTREIKGVTKSDKDIDRFILLVDAVYQRKAIVNQVTQASIPHGSVICKSYKSADGKTIVVIEVNKSSDSTAEYQLFDGTIVYRANASNYIVKTERVYSAQEFKAGIQQEQKKHAQMVRGMVRDLDTENKEKRRIESEKRIFEELLAAKILQEKKDKESQIALQQVQGYDISNSLMGCFLKFLSV